MDRKGFELAAGLIVILIVSIIIFGLASAITYKLLCSSEEKLDTYTSQQKQALEKRLATGASVVVADASKSTDQPASICGGAHSLGADYLIGVRNDGVSAVVFTANCAGGEDARFEAPGGVAGALPSGVSCESSVQAVPAPKIPVGQRSTIPVIVNLPRDAPAGRYIFTLTVSDDASPPFSRNVNLYLTVV